MNERMRKVLAVMLAVHGAGLHRDATRTQTTDDDRGTRMRKKARAALDAMVQALGGQAWLNMKNQMLQGHVAAFFHGQPDLGTTELLGVSRVAGPRPRLN